MSEVTLTEEQKHGLDLILGWLSLEERQQEFKLGGYAGTGKTTLLKSVIKALEEAEQESANCAFTGKAVNVLQRKGVPAQTMHSLMYDCEMEKGQVIFHKKSRLEGNPDLIIVDEASMISDDLYKDLKSFGKPILFVGDPGQLEPVGDNPNLMLNPDFTLETIHRQAAQSPIIKLADAVRKGFLVPNTTIPVEDQLEVRIKTLKPSEAVTADQIICAKNFTRTGMNTKIRAYKQFEPSKIVKDEKIIVLRNNLELGIFNGMILFVDSLEDGRSEKSKHDVWLAECHDEVGKKFTRLPIWKRPYTDPDTITKQTYIPRDVAYTDYGYVITCHKSQGSEWDHVIVWDEYMPPSVWDMKKWRYTAITRAAKKLTYLV